MARLAPAQRRDAIVRAALDVMVRKGMAETTVRDVAEAMGTSSGLIHHYFASMDDLLAAAFERAAQQDLAATREAMAQCPGAVARLAAFFVTYCTTWSRWVSSTSRLTATTDLPVPGPPSTM